MSTALTQLPGYVPIHRTAQQVRATRRPRTMRARYDAAQNTPDNRKHWAAADSLSPNAAIAPAVRTSLRQRARYETANNSYAKGMQLTLAYDCIGPNGPTLQIDGGAEADKIEEGFALWARAVNLAEKLRQARAGLFDSGETFGLMLTNPVLPHPVQLDLRTIETDQVGAPQGNEVEAGGIDGIRYDASGNPEAYYVYREHPGSGFAAAGEGDWIPADDMFHLFRADRPGQGRGIPECTPALNLFAMVRRTTLATVRASETAADFAMTLQTTAQPGDQNMLTPFEELEIARGMMTVLPEGYSLNQTKPEQPTTQYAAFVTALLNEIARCLNMPLNIALCNSSGYNYASGRLDHQTYDRSIAVDRQRIEQAILDRLFAAWFAEARLIPGYLPAGAKAARWHWIWQSREHVDPTKAATAQTTRLAANTTTLAIECARDGNDWRSILKQRKEEVAAELEIARMQAEIQQLRKPAPAPTQPQTEEDEDEE